MRESYSYFCPHNETSHYMNDMASLLFQPMEFVVRNLFHNPGELVVTRVLSFDALEEDGSS